MNHLDLFSGIGGFALAADRVFGDVEHIFVEIDPFCQKVLQKHWPESDIYDDIRRFTTDTISDKYRSIRGTIRETSSLPKISGETVDTRRTGGAIGLLTGGFPCQPFSQAGKRGGTADNRYLWPEMFRVIREFQPTWVIAENVRGLLTWNEGLVFEQVCADLESENYQVQPFVIPACAVNAPHRRDRVWFIANKSGKRLERCNRTPVTGYTQSDCNVKDTISQRGSGRLESNGQILDSQSTKIEDARSSWEANWTEVAAQLCRVDDGLSSELDKFTGYSRAAHRRERLKALGNAIVPQVAVEIMKGIV